MADSRSSYILPETFLDLDEVATPSPVPEHEDNAGPSLEHNLSQEKNRRASQATRAQTYRNNLSLEPASRRRSAGNEHLDNVENLFHSRTSSRPSFTQADNNTKLADNREQNNVSRNHPQGYHGHLTEMSMPPPAPESYQDQAPDSDDVDTEKHTKTSESLTKLYVVCHLIFFSIWGTLARVGLQALTVYPGVPVNQGVLWANFGGTLIMGFLAEDRKLFHESWAGTPNSLTRFTTAERAKKHMAIKKSVPLYIGLSTGFCGCFTSFSSWQRDAFLSMANAAGFNPAPRSGGYSFLALLATLILTPALCLAALQVGAHISLELDFVLPKLSSRITRKFIDPIIVPTALLCWLGAVFLAIWPPDRPSGPSGHEFWQQETWRGDAIFACIFAPLGCLTRFYVSMWLNARLPSFPLGTFTVNIFGTIMEAMFYDLQHSSLMNGIGGGFTSCQVLQGLMDGYCGSTTTISTWIAELKGLRRRHAYIYGGVSTFVGLAFMVLLMGSVYWSAGFQSTACRK